MKLTKEQAEKKYPGVAFYGDYFYIGAGADIGKGTDIWDGVNIGKGAIIRKGAVIGGDAIILEGAVIGKGAVIGEGTDIGKGTIIGRGAVIGGGRKNVSGCIVINGIGSTKTMTGFKCDDGLIIYIGCMNDYKGHTVKETKKEIAKKYDKNHIYFDAVKLIEKWYKGLEKERENVLQ